MPDFKITGPLAVTSDERATNTIKGLGNAPVNPIAAAVDGLYTGLDYGTKLSARVQETKRLNDPKKLAAAQLQADLANEVTAQNLRKLDIANSLYEKYGEREALANLASTEASTAQTRANTEGKRLDNLIKSKTGLQSAQVGLFDKLLGNPSTGGKSSGSGTEISEAAKMAYARQGIQIPGSDPSQLDPIKAEALENMRLRRKVAEQMFFGDSLQESAELSKQSDILNSNNRVQQKAIARTNLAEKAYNTAIAGAQKTGPLGVTDHTSSLAQTSKLVELAETSNDPKEKASIQSKLLEYMEVASPSKDQYLDSIDDPEQKKRAKEEFNKAAAYAGDPKYLSKDQNTLAKGGFSVQSVSKPDETFDQIDSYITNGATSVENEEVRSILQGSPYAYAARQASKGTGGNIIIEEVPVPPNANESFISGDVTQGGSASMMLQFRGADGTVIPVPLPETQQQQNALNLVTESIRKKSATLQTNAENQQEIESLIPQPIGANNQPSPTPTPTATPEGLSDEERSKFIFERDREKAFTQSLDKLAIDYPTSNENELIKSTKDIVDDKFVRRNKFEDTQREEIAKLEDSADFAEQKRALISQLTSKLRETGNTEFAGIKSKGERFFIDSIEPYLPVNITSDQKREIIETAKAAEGASVFSLVKDGFQARVLDTAKEIERLISFVGSLDNGYKRLTEIEEFLGSTVNARRDLADLKRQLLSMDIDEKTANDFLLRYGQNHAKDKIVGKDGQLEANYGRLTPDQFIDKIGLLRKRKQELGQSGQGPISNDELNALNNLAEERKKKALGNTDSANTVTPANADVVTPTPTPQSSDTPTPQPESTPVPGTATPAPVPTPGRTPTPEGIEPNTSVSVDSDPSLIGAIPAVVGGIADDLAEGVVEIGVKALTFQTNTIQQRFKDELKLDGSMSKEQMVEQVKNIIGEELKFTQQSDLDLIDQVMFNKAEELNSIGINISEKIQNAFGIGNPEKFKAARAINEGIKKFKEDFRKQNPTEASVNEVAGFLTDMVAIEGAFGLGTQAVGQALFATKLGKDIIKSSPKLRKFISLFSDKAKAGKIATIGKGALETTITRGVRAAGEIGIDAFKDGVLAAIKSDDIPRDEAAMKEFMNSAEFQGKLRGTLSLGSGIIKVSDKVARTIHRAATGKISEEELARKLAEYQFSPKVLTEAADEAAATGTNPLGSLPTDSQGVFRDISKEPGARAVEQNTRTAREVAAKQSEVDGLSRLGVSDDIPNIEALDQTITDAIDNTVTKVTDEIKGTRTAEATALRDDAISKVTREIVDNVSNDVNTSIQKVNKLVGEELAEAEKIKSGFKQNALIELPNRLDIMKRFQGKLGAVKDSMFRVIEKGANGRPVGFSKTAGKEAEEILIKNLGQEGYQALRNSISKAAVRDIFSSAGKGSPNNNAPALINLWQALGEDAFKQAGRGSAGAGGKAAKNIDAARSKLKTLINKEFKAKGEGSNYFGRFIDRYANTAETLKSVDKQVDTLEGVQNAITLSFSKGETVRPTTLTTDFFKGKENVNKMKNAFGNKAFVIKETFESIDAATADLANLTKNGIASKELPTHIRNAMKLGNAQLNEGIVTKLIKNGSPRAVEDVRKTLQGTEAEDSLVQAGLSYFRTRLQDAKNIDRSFSGSDKTLKNILGISDKELRNIKALSGNESASSDLIDLIMKKELKSAAAEDILQGTARIVQSADIGGKFAPTLGRRLLETPFILIDVATSAAFGRSRETAAKAIMRGISDPNVQNVQDMFRKTADMLETIQTVNGPKVVFKPTNEVIDATKEEYMRLYARALRGYINTEKIEDAQERKKVEDLFNDRKARDELIKKFKSS